MTAASAAVTGVTPGFACGCSRPGQFFLLVGVNAPVGGMVVQERTVLLVPAEDELGLATFTTAHDVYGGRRARPFESARGRKEQDREEPR